VSNKRASQDRKARLAEVQDAQRAKERRIIVAIVAAVTVVLLVLAGLVVYAISDARSQQLPNLGASAAQAGCDAATTDATTGGGEHVGPGTRKPDQTTVEYETVPPSHGPHFARPVLDGPTFYTEKDRPPVEALVHNLEHGYTVLWYDPAKAKGQEALLKDIAEKANKQPQAQGKFIVVPWESERGAFPDGKPYALSHWSKDAGHRQFCGELSGQAVIDFIEKFPQSDAPEAGAP
jgi:hypothetical protein